MDVLIAYEESQAICIEMRRLGHRAFSCDVQECSGGHPEWHIMGDALPLINGRCEFKTMDGKTHRIEGRWDLLIAHPPCTYLTAAGAVRLFPKGILNEERFEKGKQAASFFLSFWNADCERIAIENPVPMKCFGLPPYTYLDEPYNHGDPWRKRTGFWLKNLDPLHPTNVVEPLGLWVGSTCANRDPSIYTRYELRSKRDSKNRSKTFPGIARAIAEQWAGTNEEAACNLT